MRPTSQRGVPSTIVRPRPTKLSGIATIVAGAVFLLFSALPFAASDGEARPFALLFGAIWVLACLSFIAYGVYIIASKKPSSGLLYEVEGQAAGQPEGPRDGFDARLRGLEGLRRDGLITEEEYRRKREEILNAPW
jgi:hypothetical protein